MYVLVDIEFSLLWVVYRGKKKGFIDIVWMLIARKLSVFDSHPNYCNMTILDLLNDPIHTSDYDTVTSLLHSLCIDSLSWKE